MDTYATLTVLSAPFTRLLATFGFCRYSRLQGLNGELLFMPRSSYPSANDMVSSTSTLRMIPL
ncbi:hypothetical protein BABINDRAFT_160831 [Babjeviella inositovora NRRL Y-12698]|uniref:Uncharacterized protein n=1 Tax=Babjeviella inositovora NRRL Y-12698 TaxID=984486 RepID=A0A1E3QSF0_9ASCO|nr:uncharacterized protein BABINDRAFT_160831 [Babjeviella inositovora NRRL Y-12698]ODQ80568.1 hypothetical protein BABINDRAFT_160831 [Babjeviella inositovora NRRL Y-12698]